MSKYIRHQAVISRNADNSIDEEHWLNKLNKSLTKDAVQPKKVDDSLFNQINSVINGKSKFKSVEAKVEEMKERSGFTAYLDKVKMSKTKIQNKIASKNTPEVIQQQPQILSTLQNIITDSKGNLSIPAILNRVRSIHQNDISDQALWEDNKLLVLISNLNLQAKQNNPINYENYHNLGTKDNSQDIDQSNTDAFHALNPAKF